MFKKITIVGVGLIGGSIGLACRGKLAKEVVGVCRRRLSAWRALKAKAVDKTTLNLKKGVEGADLIVLATSVGKIVELGRASARYAKNGALMTDVGSTKRYIVESLERVSPGGVAFVGSHPMAGSEKGGALNAEKSLFKNRDCFITRTKNTNRRALGKIKKFWAQLGSRPIVVSPEEHDRIAAKISQMVHIVASGLVIANKDALKYAASGFRDTTRIALADPGLWDDICVTNRRDIAASLDGLITILKSFKSAISRKDTRAIKAMLEKARKLRNSVK